MYDKINVNFPAAYKPVNNSPFNDNRNNLIICLNQKLYCVLINAYCFTCGKLVEVSIPNGQRCYRGTTSKKLLSSSDITPQSDDLW